MSDGYASLVDGRKSQCFPDREALAASDGSSILTVSDGYASSVEGLNGQDCLTGKLF